MRRPPVRHGFTPPRGLGAAPPARPTAPFDDTIAVLSDASDFRREPGSSVLTELLESAALLREHTGVRATALLVSGGSADALAGEVGQVALDFSAGYLVRTDPSRARAVQRALAGTIPVITDATTTAIALVAAALTTLARAGTDPAGGHLLIAGAARNPHVAALARAAGIARIDGWDPEDAGDEPPCDLDQPGGVLIDLRHPGAGHRTEAPQERGAPVVAVEGPATALLAVPALLATTRLTGGPPRPADRLSCVRHLVARTPPGRLLPTLAEVGPMGPAGTAVPATRRRRRAPWWSGAHGRA